MWMNDIFQCWQQLFSHISLVPTCIIYLSEEKNFTEIIMYYIWITFSTVFGSLSSSTTLAWSSPAIFYLQNVIPDNQFNSTTFKQDNFENQITDDEISLISSILQLGGIFGSLPAGLLCEKFGRRTTLLLANLLLTSGWVFICSAERNILMLFIARALHGMALGLHSVAIPLYNEEVTEVQFRGATGSMYEFSEIIGLFLVAVFQAVASYLWMNISCMTLAICSVIGLLLIPETPVYYLKCSDIQKAEKSLSRLRGVKENSSYSVATELSSLQRMVDLSKQRTGNQSRNKNFLCFKKLNFQDFCSPTAKAIYIISFLMVLRQFSGITVLTSYTNQLFEHSDNNMSPFLSTLISRTVQISFSFIPIFFVDRIGRRIFLLISTGLSAVCLSLLSLYFYLKLEGYNIESLNWLPIFSTGFFFCTFSFGLGPIPWFMMAEIIPTESKGWVTGLCSMIYWFCGFIAVESVLTIIKVIGDMGQYILYCIIDVIGFIIILLIVPETKNKPIETIHEELVKFHIKIKCF